MYAGDTVTPLASFAVQVGEVDAVLLSYDNNTAIYRRAVMPVDGCHIIKYVVHKGGKVPTLRIKLE